MVDIFQDQFKKSMDTNAKFFNFTKEGDKIQGTFIRRHNVTGDKFRGDCFNYEIMDEEGNYHLINGGKGGTAVIDKDMMNVKPGMIIGIELVELRDTGKVNPAKIFAVYYDEAIKNEDWLKQNQGQLDFVADNTAAPVASATPSQNDEIIQKTKKIMDLAKIKLGATDANDAKARIVENTGLAFITQNQDMIIQKLEALPDLT